MNAKLLAPPQVVLSYAAADSGLASLLASALRQSGIDIFDYQSLEVTPGRSWVDEIRERLRTASSIVLLLTPASLQSSWLIYEAGAAMALNLPALVVYDGIGIPQIPASLQSLQAIPLSKFEELVSALLRDRE